MSWFVAVVVSAPTPIDAFWATVGHLATLSNAITLLLALIGLFFVWLAGSKAQREAIAKTIKQTVEALEDGIRAATLRADAEEKRADAATLRSEAEKERADAAEARADAEQQRADAAVARGDAEKMRADSQTARASSLEIKNAELLNSSTADQTRFLATIKAVSARNVDLEARVADLEARLGMQHDEK